MYLSTLKLAGVSFLVSRSRKASKRQLRSDVTKEKKKKREQKKKVRKMR